MAARNILNAASEKWGPIPGGPAKPAPDGADAKGEVGQPSWAESAEKGGRRGGSGVIFWLLFLAVLGAIVFGAYRFRSEVVRLWPEAVKLYALVGVNAEGPPGYGLRIVENSIRFRWETAGGASNLIVTGTIENFVGTPQRVPPVRLMLVGKDLKTLHSELLNLGEKVLGPGEKFEFSTEIRNAPDEAAQVLIRFQGADS